MNNFPFTVREAVTKFHAMYLKDGGEGEKWLLQSWSHGNPETLACLVIAASIDSKIAEILRPLIEPFLKDKSSFEELERKYVQLKPEFEGVIPFNRQEDVQFIEELIRLGKELGVSTQFLEELKIQVQTSIELQI